TPRAVEAVAPIRGSQALDPDARPWARRMHELAVAEIDPDVRVRAIARVVEHQVAGLQLAQLRDRRADLAQRFGARRQQQAPRALEHVRDEAAAVEAGFRRAAAQAVLHSEDLQRLNGRALAVARAVMPS